jgi:hypothetical protein
MEFQLLARQKSREQNDEQRPQIIDQAGFRGRREPEREKIERVIAEQPEYPERPDFGGWRSAESAPLRKIQDTAPSNPPMVKVIAAS